MWGELTTDPLLFFMIFLKRSKNIDVMKETRKEKKNESESIFYSRSTAEDGNVKGHRHFWIWRKQMKISRRKLLPMQNTLCRMRGKMNASTAGTKFDDQFLLTFAK
jgi:hypothetical protein